MVALNERPEIEIADPNPTVPEEVTSLVEKAGSVEALIAQRSETEGWRQIEAIEGALAELPQQPLPLNHVFAGGMYARSIFMPAGTLLTSRIHLLEHIFIISAGVVSIWDNGWTTLQASHVGVTKPGTRRVLYIHEDCIFTTVHTNPTNETDPDEMVKRVTYTGGKFKELGAAKS